MPFTLQEVSSHNSTKSCWIIIRGRVYDVTEFLPTHPGGSKIILKYAGRDATDAFEPIHPPNVLEDYLPKEKHLGDLDPAGTDVLNAQRDSREKTEDELRVEREHAAKPPLNRVLDLQQMEDIARRVLPKKVLAYYSSASDNEITHQENEHTFSRFFFLPKFLRPLSGTDPSTTILGFRSAIPVFVSSAGLAKLGHPLGEANITRGAGHTGIIQLVSSNASLSYASIASHRVSPDQPLFFQLYKHRDDDRAAARVREVERLGYQAIWLTVDAPFSGNRERDVRAGWETEDLQRLAQTGKGLGGEKKMVEEIPRTREVEEIPRTREDLEEAEEEPDVRGTAGALVANDDADMTWHKTIPWLRSITTLPLVIKGIQCVEDAVLAAEAGVDGILLSNHGGRQLDYTLPPMEVLYKLRIYRPDVFDKLEVYIDGGVKRGTDVLKALCLGARAVGLGRQFLYAQSAYGAAGVVKTARILEREIVTSIRLLGVRTVAELRPDMVEKVDWQPLLRTKL